jgi:Rieske 2Fe-2S family protein
MAGGDGWSMTAGPAGEVRMGSPMPAPSSENAAAASTRLDPEEVSGVLQPLEHARGLPARAYLDAGVLAFERTAIFARSWACVGRESDVEQPGSWVRAELGGDDAIVIRGDDLELRAFYNVCRHRGTPLLDGDAGRCRTLECPYHGWRYATDGALLEAPHAPRELTRADFGLSPLRVARWQGFVFVSRGPLAPELAEWMASPPPWLVDVDLRQARRARRVRYAVAANWKLLVANFQESHHFVRVHPALERLTPTARATTLLTDGPWLGGEMEIATDTVSTSGSRAGRPLLVGKDRERRVFDAMLFPALLTSLQPDYFLTYRLEPLAAARTEVFAEIFVHPAARDESLSEIFDFWDQVNAEDRAICERQQRGVASAGYAPGPYTSVDEGVHAFEQLVARCHGEGAR